MVGSVGLMIVWVLWRPAGARHRHTGPLGTDEYDRSRIVAIIVETYDDDKRNTTSRLAIMDQVKNVAVGCRESTPGFVPERTRPQWAVPH
jgi:hypothetical protein